MLDQVIRMLVVTLVVDVVSDVVKQSGIGQDRAVGRVEFEARADRVEQLQGEPLHLPCVRRLVVAALGELAHRSLARLTGIGDGRHHTRRFQEQPFADAERRRGHLGRFDAGHHLRHHAQSGNDDVGAPRVEAGNGEPLRQYDANNASHQKWVFKSAGTVNMTGSRVGVPAFYIENNSTGRVIDVPGFSLGNVGLQAYTRNGGTNQKWVLEYVGP